MISSERELVLEELYGFVCETKLGEGVARVVYTYRLDSSKVIKVEGTGSFQNVREFETWDYLQNTPYAKYLAPCFELSQCGRILIQQRVDPLPHGKVEWAKTGIKLSEVRMPDFLSDFKMANYGIYKGQVVACDYGSNLLLNHGAFASKMKKPKWWE